MSFTQPCFIRKNTPELREKLENLGYKPFGMVEMGFGLSTDELLAEYESFDDSALENILKVSGTEDYKESIDCGDNELLFLALAALRNDTDKNQYCIDSEGNWFLYNRTFVRLLSKTNVTWHKATVGEIIEHFKTKTRVTDEIPFELFKKLDKTGFTCRKTYSQPTLDDALKWLRDEKSLYVEPCILTDADTDADGKLICEYTYWSFRITHIEAGDVIYSEHAFINGKRFDFYEEAAIAGINYVLDEMMC